MVEKHSTSFLKHTYCRLNSLIFMLSIIKTRVYQRMTYGLSNRKILHKEKEYFWCRIYKKYPSMNN